MKVYLAGGWFTPESATHLEHIRGVLRRLDVDFFDPMNDNLFQPGMKPEDVVAGNIWAINDCDFMIACVDRFKRFKQAEGYGVYEVDVGTAVEVGIALAKDLPLVYVWYHGMPGEKFNLMLAATGAVVTDDAELQRAIYEILDTGHAQGKELSHDSIE